MAIFVFTNGFVQIGATDLSDHGSKVTTIDDRAEVDVTSFSSAGYVQVTKGLGNAEIDVDLWQDFAASKTHATLSAQISSTTPFAVEVRPVNSGRSATNPAVLMSNSLLFTYRAIDSKVGDGASVTATFKNAPSGSGITYPTS